MSNTKSTVSGPSKPTEMKEQDEVINDGKDPESNIPNGGVDKTKAHKTMKKKNSKTGKKDDGKVLHT